MSEPIVSYECPLGGEHEVPGEDVRVLMVGDTGFVIACDCADEPLDEAHEPPHPTDRHLVNVYHRDVTEEDWLAFEELADGWYDEDPWVPRDDDDHGTPLERRQEVREIIEDGADGVETAKKAGEREIDEDAREVECPNCGANEGVKCERPSGHSVRKCHGARVDRAREEGLIDDEPEAETETEQAGLSGWSA